MEVVDVPARMGRSQLVRTADGVVLVDAGMRALPSVERALTSLGLTIADIRLIVLTHGDGDHVGGVKAIQDASGADVVAHELELEYIGGRVPRWFPISKRAFGIVGRGMPRPTVTRLMSGDHMAIGEIELVHAPGHTPGHVVVYAGDVLMAGDAFRTGPEFAQVPGLMTVDPRRSRATIRKLAERPIDRAFSGHGPPSEDATERLRGLASGLPQDPPRS